MRELAFTQKGNQAHTPEEKRKKVLTFLRLRREGWPHAVVVRRAGTDMKRAKIMAANLGIPWED